MLAVDGAEETSISNALQSPEGRAVGWGTMFAIGVGVGGSLELPKLPQSSMLDEAG